MREIKQVIKYAKKLNFTVTRTKNGHLRFDGFGHRMFASSTTSDYRAFIKIRKSLFKIANNTFVNYN